MAEIEGEVVVFEQEETVEQVQEQGQGEQQQYRGRGGRGRGRGSRGGFRGDRGDRGGERRFPRGMPPIKKNQAEDALNEKIKKISEEWNTVQNRIIELKKAIKEKQKQAGYFTSDEEKARNQVFNLEEKVAKIELEKKDLQDQIDQTKGIRKQRLDDAHKIRSKFSIKIERELEKNIEALDAKILEIDSRMQRESLGIKEQRDCLGLIQKYRQEKIAVREYDQNVTNILKTTGTKHLENKLEKLDATLNSFREKQEERKKNLANFNNKKSEPTEIPKLQEELDAAVDKSNELADALRIEKQALVDSNEVHNQKEIDKYLEGQKKRRERKQEFDTKKKAEFEERRQERLSNQPLKFQTELTLCDDLIKYLNSLLSPAATKAAVQQSTGLDFQEVRGNSQVADGSFKRKEKVNEFASLKQRKEKKAPVTKETESLKHDVTLLLYFEKLSMKPPLIFKDIPAVLNTLITKKAEFSDLQSKFIAKEKASTVPEEDERAAFGEASPDSDVHPHQGLEEIDQDIHDEQILEEIHEEILHEEEKEEEGEEQ